MPGGESSMQNRNLILFWLTLVALIAVPLRAHQVALKDGKTIQFERYHSTETMLFYTAGDGKEVAIPLKDVDLERTRRLNATEPMPLDLPGLIPPGGTNGGEPSLADIARQQRKGISVTPAKRVLTDDDVPHASPAVAHVQVAPPEDARLDTKPIQKIIDKLANKSQTQLASEAAGDIQFPDRDAWEKKLYGQGQRVLRFAQSYLDRVKKLDAITDPAERSTASEIAKNFEWQTHEEETLYNQISTEGSQKAKELEKQPK
jgi:hypothetical protein